MDAFKSLGFNADEMGQKFAKGGKDGAQAFQEVVKKLNDVKDPVEKNRIGVELFGTQFEDLQAKGVATLANIGTTADSTKNTMQEIDKVRYDSFGQAMQGIGRTIMIDLFNPFQEKVMPKVNEFAQWITDHMPQIESGIESAMGTAAKIFDDLQKAIKWVIDNLNILGPVIAGVTGAILAQMIIDALTKLYKTWKLATESQTTAQWLLNAAMDANPIGLVALAIGALIAIGLLLWQNWDTVTKSLGIAWNWMKSSAISIFNFLVEFFKKWGLDILAVIMGPIGILALYIYRNWDEIKAKAVSIFSSIGSFLSSSWNGIKSTAVSVWNGIKTAIMTPIYAAKEGVSNAIQFIKGLFNGLKLKLPNIKTPHFGIKNWSLNPMDWIKAMPKLTVDWYAKGTDFAPGGLAVVGEQGPELINLPRGSKVHTASETAQMMGNNFYFERMLDGAIFNVREEADIKKIAKELGDYTRQTARGKGVVM